MNYNLYRVGDIVYVNEGGQGGFSGKKAVIISIDWKSQVAHLAFSTKLIKSDWPLVNLTPGKPAPTIYENDAKLLQKHIFNQFSGSRQNTYYEGPELKGKISLF